MVRGNVLTRFCAIISLGYGSPTLTSVDSIGPRVADRVLTAVR